MRESHPDLVLESDDALSLSPGTYDAARAAVSCALSGAHALVEGKERLSYALCRPPGHHATGQKSGGYCFFNNAALAAKYLRDKGKSRPVILDIDVHHGNGTQEIVYDEPNILFASLNGKKTYPHDLGKIRDPEQDPMMITSKILNITIEQSTNDSEYLWALNFAIDWIKLAGSDSIVVSAGFDTSIGERKDIFSSDFGGWEKFGLTKECYYKIGQNIRDIGLPVLALQEGGYNLKYVGQDVAAFLSGLARK